MCNTCLQQCLSPAEAAAPRQSSVWAAPAWRRGWWRVYPELRSPSPTRTASHSQQRVPHGSERTHAHTHTNPNKAQLFEPWGVDPLILWLTCANRRSAVKLMLSSLSACSISLLFCSTSLSMASCSSWLWGQAHKTHLKSSPWTKKVDSRIEDHNNARSRCCLVPLMNPAKLEVNVWLD